MTTSDLVCTPQRFPKTLVVVPTCRYAEQLRRDNKNPLMMFVGVGQNLAGHRFQTIVNTVTATDINSGEELFKVRKWFEHLNCLLTADGIFIRGAM